MKYYFSTLLCMMMFTGFSQEKPIPEFFLKDPAIYKNDKLYIPSSHLKNFSFNQDFATVIIKDSSGGVEKKRKGIINSKGKFIISPDYMNAEVHPQGIIALRNEAGHWRFYKISEGNILEGEFQDYKIISSQYILVCQKNKWGILIIGKKEIKLIEPIYKSIIPVSGNSFKVCHLNSWTLKNEKFESIKTYFYDTLFFRNDSLLSYQINKASGIVSYSSGESRYGEKLRKLNPDKSKGENNEGFLKVVENNQYGVSDSNGKTIIPTKYDSIGGPFEDVFIVYSKGLIGIIDKEGNFLSELNNRFDKVQPFCEGRARVTKGGQYGFIDQRGAIRVAPQYFKARNFKEGAAAVFLNGKWGFIDKDENIIVQPHYQEVLDFKNGMARANVGGKWYFVNKEGKKLSNAYHEIKETQTDKWILITNKKQGLADRNGKELLAPRYDWLEDLENGRVIVKKGERWGVVDYRENFVTPIEFDFVSYNKENKLFLFMLKGKEELIEIKSEVLK